MHIMIAVDGTSSAEHAAEAAAHLFGAEARYTVVSVGKWPAALVAPPAGVMPAYVHVDLGPVPPAEDLADDGAADAAEAVAAQIPGETEVLTPTGDPGPVLVTLAEDRNADVIVIGFQDRSWWSRLLEPSVGSHLIEHAPCPVLVVRPPEDA